MIDVSWNLIGSLAWAYILFTTIQTHERMRGLDTLNDRLRTFGAMGAAAVMCLAFFRLIQSVVAIWP